MENTRTSRGGLNPVQPGAKCIRKGQDKRPNHMDAVFTVNTGVQGAQIDKNKAVCSELTARSVKTTSAGRSRAKWSLRHRLI